MTVQTRLSAKGQVVIPKVVRERMHWPPGIQLELIERQGSLTLRPLSYLNPFPRSTIDDLRKLPGYKGKPKSVEEISGLDDGSLRQIFDERDLDEGSGY